ncbi:hypothetical protein HS125_16425 [bacterium]|nr:hypothetical protein [bacterium]
MVTTRDHLRWISEEVGAGVYASPTLLLAREEALGLVEFAPPEGDRTPTRADMIKLLCPGCRRAVVARELWG